MAKRRDSGTGYPFKVKTGWKIVVVVGWKTGKDGKKRPITRTKTLPSKADVIAWAAQLKAERDAGTAEPQQSSMILADWVTTWLADVERDQSTSTFQAYEHHARGFLVPALGRYPIRDIKPMGIRNMLADLEQEYGGRSTLQEVYKISRICFEAAKQLELIVRNPVDAVQRPKYQREDIHPFSKEDIWLILSRARPDRLYGALVLAFSLGMRQGELWALEWEDIDWEESTLTIERQAVSNRGKIEIKPPKTKSGRRTLVLADEVVSVLRDRQRMAMAEGLAGCPLVFPAPRGGYVNRSSFAFRTWKPILRACGIDERGLHHARHSFATHALLAGCPLHVVSKILGHANPSITLNIYSHLVDTAQSETVSKVAQLLVG